MSIISIRAAKIQDLDVLLTFEQGVVEAERPMDPFLAKGDISYYNIEELIAQENIHLVVAVSGDDIVGCGYIRIQDSRIYHKNLLHGYIGFMFVKPEFRGKNISGLILENLKNWAENKGLKELRLDVYHNNPSAIKSYERFGFTKSLLNMRVEI